MKRIIASTALRVLVVGVLFVDCVLAHIGFGMVVNHEGKIFFLDNVRGRVWVIESGSRLVPFAPGKHGNNLVPDANGNLFVEDFNSSLWKIAPDGRIIEVPAPYRQPGGVGWLDELLAVDRDGNFYFSGGNEFRQGFWLVRKVTPAGQETVLAGSVQGHADGKGSEARFTNIRTAAWGPDGALYVSDANSVRRVSMDGVVTTLAGSATPGFADDPGRTARFERVLGLAVDARGNVFVVDTDNFRVRKITPDGQVSTLIRVWLPWKPAGVAVAGDEVYILEHRFMPLPMVEKWFTTHRVRKLRPDGTVITVATVGGGGGIVIGAMMGAIVLAVWQLRRRRRWHR